MSDPVVTTVKCVNTVSGSERYCCSVYFPVSGVIADPGLIARVVVPYEEMGAVYDRVVDVGNVDIIVGNAGSVQPHGFSDVSIGLFDTGGNISTYVGRYKLTNDSGFVRVGDCGGAVVVSQGYYFGVRLLQGYSPANLGITVNFEFSLVGHSL